MRKKFTVRATIFGGEKNAETALCSAVRESAVAAKRIKGA